MNKEKSTILNEKDMILLIRGGHGFKVLKKIPVTQRYIMDFVHFICSASGRPVSL